MQGEILVLAIICLRCFRGFQIYLVFPGGVVAEPYLLTEFSGEIREGHDDLSPLVDQSLALFMRDATQWKTGKRMTRANPS